FQPKLAFSFQSKPYQLQIKTSLLKPSLSTVVQAFYQITPEYLQFQAQYQLSLKDVGLFQVEIPVPSTMEVTQVSAKEKTIESWSLQNSKILVKFLRETTQTTLSIQGLLPTKEEQELTVGFPEQSLKNEGYLAFDSESELTINVQKLTDLEEKPRSESQYKIGNRGKVYRILGKNAQIHYQITTQLSEITGTVYTLYTFVRGYIVAQSEVVLEVQNAGIRKLSIVLPPKAGNLIITGQEILDFYPREQDYQIELKNKIQGTLSFFVNYDLPFSIFGKSTCTMDGIDIPALKEIRGFEGWTKSETPIEVLLEQQKGYEFKSQQDIPRESPSKKFKLSRDTYAIKDRVRSFQLKINGLDQTQLQEVQISNLSIRTEVNAEGKLTTRLTCRFQNTTRQFLRVKMDQKANLWGTYIIKSPVLQTASRLKGEDPSLPLDEGKEPVKPTIGKNGEILVPIPKNVQDAELEMIFVDNVDKMGYMGDLDLISPAIEDVQIEKLSWDLVVPKNYLLLRHEGAFELKPVDSTLLPDTLVGLLQNEIVSGLNRFLPHFLKVSEQGAWAVLILFGMACFGFLIFAGYRYYGPDYFLLVCGKTLFLVVLFVLFVFLCQSNLSYGLFFLGTVLFGFLAYRLRAQIIDQFLLTEKGAFTPSRRTVFTLLILLTVVVVLKSMLLDGSNVKSLLQGANSTFKDGREFQEMSTSESYDDSADQGKHKTGRMEGDDDDGGRYYRSKNSRNSAPQKTAPSGANESQIAPRQPSSIEVAANESDGDLNERPFVEELKRDVFEEDPTADKVGNKKQRKQLVEQKPKKSLEAAKKEKMNELHRELESDKPEEGTPDNMEPVTEEEAQDAKGAESRADDHLKRDGDFNRDAEKGKDIAGLYDETTKSEAKRPESGIAEKLPVDPAVLAEEQQKIQVLTLQVDSLQKRIQQGELDRLGVDFSTTYRNVQQGNFLVLQGQQQQLQAQLNVLQQQLGQQIIFEDKEKAPNNALGKSGSSFQSAAESSYRDGQQFLQQGQFQEAINELNKALVLNPNNTRARQLLEESEKLLQASEETSKELQKSWEKSAVHLENGELEEAEKLLDEIQRRGASSGRNSKIKTLIQQSQERKKLISEGLAQLRNWQRMTKERIQQEIQNKFQVKLGNEIINIEKFTCNYPQNPLIQVAVDKLLQQARVDLQNLRKSILNPDAFQQGLKTEGLTEQFARVKNGRSAGALPIPVNLPSENRKGFSFEVTLTDKPEAIKFVFMNRNISYFWQVLLIALLWGGLYTLSRKNIQNGRIGLLGSAILLASLYNFSDIEYLPYLKTGLYAVGFYIPILLYQTLWKRIEN
ncbi:MAG: tetratricopeptide repeat protein, partial [Planctomycetota bacterium]